MRNVSYKVRFSQKVFMSIPLHFHRALISRAGQKGGQQQWPSTKSNTNKPLPRLWPSSSIIQAHRNWEEKKTAQGPNSGSLNREPSVAAQCVYTYSCAILLTQRTKINPSYSWDCLALSMCCGDKVITVNEGFNKAVQKLWLEKPASLHSLFLQFYFFLIQLKEDADCDEHSHESKSTVRGSKC